MKKFIPFFFSIIILLVFITATNSPDSKTISKESRSAEKEDFKLNLLSAYPLDLSELSVQNKLSNEANSPETSGWYSEAMSNIQKSEYNVTYSDELNTYQSPNRANNMRFIYNKRGFTAKIRSSKIALFDESDKMIEEKDKKYEYLDDWKVEFDLESVSKDYNSDLKNDFMDFDNKELAAGGNKISIENDNLRIQYLNDENGMRQDFIVKNKPEGAGKLRLNLSADTKLKMIVGADALMFKDKKGNDMMKYSSLKCWDANGVELRAYFEKQLLITNYKLQIEDQENQIPNSKFQIPNHKNLISKIKDQKSFTIVVNDDDAVYPITIDPLSEIPDWSYENNQGSSQLGYSVAAAGDVNGDGFGDVIVGAPYFDGGQSDEGRIYVFHGSAAGSSTFPNYIKENDTAGSNFGYSVATAGDVNGDGYSDIIVGSPQWNGTGKAYVYHGSSSGLSVTNNWQKQINQANADFGNSVSTAGDINNDGYSDVIIGAPLANDGQTDEGRANIYLGSSTGLSDLIHVRLEVNSVNAHLGECVSLAGDVNGDGYSDVIVSADRFTNGQQDEGRVYIYIGSSSGITNTQFWTVESNQDFAYLGNSVSTAGDVNGDGLSDVIIGADSYEDDNSGEGRAFVYYGNALSMSTTPAWTGDINQSNAYFGSSVGTAGDVNGDGYADVIIGSYGFENGQPDEGKAYVFFGSITGLSTSSDWSDQSNQIDAQFGWSVATAGDVNGDGFSDIIVGARLYDNAESNEGRAFIYYGYADGLRSLVNWTFELNQANAYFGRSVSTAGDVNGDGYSDIIIGAPYYDNGDNREGAAFVFHGSAAGLSSFPNWTVEGNQNNATYGYSTSTAGDVNGDGFSDVIVGARLYDNGEIDEGVAFAYYGSSSGLSFTANWVGELNHHLALFGSSVAAAGDVNGDGYSDVIIGAHEYTNNEFEEGAIIVYHGSSTGLENNYAIIIEGNAVESNFGMFVSGAGDVNGDGFSDVIVGSPLNGLGFAHVYQGSNSGLSSFPSWIKGNVTNSNLFGYSVSTAGDVNGDGYSDIIIGSPFFNSGQSNEGAAYIYHGSSSGLQNVYARLLQSNQISAEFGISVSNAGDVNGDGYSDIMIGAPYYSNGNTVEGKAFVYLGSNSGVSSVEDWSEEGNIDEAFFGFSVSSAGDVNGDGYSDVLVGASRYNNGQTQEGKVFSYYGNKKSGLRAFVQQYEPNTLNIISSGGFTKVNNEARLSIFGKSPFGRVKGRLVDEVKQNGSNFSGNPISKSTAYSSFGSYTDLGTTGTELIQNISGLSSANVYKWRARVQYSLVKNPYQSYGPWKYYNNYVPTPLGNFRPKERIPLTQQLDLTMFIQGFYNSGSDDMVGDTVTVYLRNSYSTYDLVDSAKSFVDSAGLGIFTFSNAVDGTPYYLEVSHRNSIETWSKTPQQFTASMLSYDFTTANTQAFGDNMANIDASPVRFGIYSGDQNQNGIVDLTDVVNVSNAASTFTNGYVSADMNGDNITDLSDIVITSNNASAFVAAVIP